MRTTIYAGLISLLLTVPLCCAEEFPYTATVSQNNVTARSGPTFGAYSTESLPRGTQVEVHQTGANGWLAIRPPENAFADRP